MVEHGNYISRPSKITAFRWEGQPPSEWPEWARNSLKLRYEITNIQVDGRHGTIRCNRGDWVIRLSEDDLYPCDHQVFCRKYEKVDDAG